MPEKKLLTRAEPAKAALKRLPTMFSREKKAKYANLLEQHKQYIAETGGLHPEIVLEANRDFLEQQRTAGKIGLFTTATLYLTLFELGKPLLLYGAGGWGIGRLFGAAQEKTKKIVSAITKAQEKRRTAGLSVEEMRARNLEIVEARIRKLRGNR